MYLFIIIKFQQRIKLSNFKEPDEIRCQAHH